MRLMIPEEIRYDVARNILGLSNCLRRHYACVIVGVDGRVVSRGYNHSLTGCATCAREGKEHNQGDYSECHSIHAEMMGLLNADRNKLHGATLYLVCNEEENPMPCPICQRMMEWCGVSLAKRKGNKENE